MSQLLAAQRSTPRDGLRTAGRLAVALGAWVLLLNESPLPAGDALRGTLAVLPLVLVLLTEIRRRAARAGAKEPWERGRRWEAGAVAVWVVLVLARPRLGLSLPDPALIAAGAAVLLLHATRLLLSFRPLLGARLPERPPVVFFALPFAVYVALVPWSTEQRSPNGDEPWYLLVTHSLAFDLDADLTNNYVQRDYLHFIDRELEPQPGDPRGPEGELYSRHNELLPLVLAPSYRVAGKLGALLSMAALSAALAWMTLRVGSRYVPDHPGGMLLSWGLLALGPPLLLYSYQVWVEVPAALLTLVALDRIRELGRRDRKSDWLVCAGAIVLLPFLKLRFGLLAAPLTALAAWHSRHRLRRHWLPIALLLGAVLLAGGLILIYNQQQYGNPLKIHRWSELELHREQLSTYTLGLTGLFWDSAFGLFAVAPLWLLTLPAVVLALRRRSVALFDGLVAMSAYFVVVASRREWFGGWSPPFRYGLVLLPLLAVLLAPLLSDRHAFGRRLLIVTLTVLTFALTLLWVAVPGWAYNFANGSTLLLDHLELRSGCDLIRFFPSAIRPRAATVAVPLLGTLLVLGLWWLPLERRRGAAALGIVLSLLAPLLLTGAARSLTTHVVEAEAPHVSKIGGEPYPPPWELDRPRFREGWILRQGERLEAPVIVGGAQLRPRLLIRNLAEVRGPVTAELLAGGEVLASVRLTYSEAWHEIFLGPIPWPPEASTLGLRVRRYRQPARGVIVDRITLGWE